MGGAAARRRGGGRRGSHGGGRVDAGDGDDILLWDSSDFRIEGGAGRDTLRVDAGDVVLSGFTGTITGIDRIDLSGDLGANTVTLDARDVLDISDNQAITLLGDAIDRVDAGAGWSDGGLDGLGYQIYTQAVGSSLATRTHREVFSRRLCTIPTSVSSRSWDSEDGAFSGSSPCPWCWSASTRCRGSRSCC